jgi:N utilization substance protein A
MKNEFVLAFNEVIEDKQLPREVILEALEAAMVSAYRRAVNASNAQQIEASVDIETGKVTIYAEKEVVDAVQDARTEVALKDARKVNKETAIGEMVVVESTPRNFGRVAAQTARQVIQQRIREAEREAQHTHFSKQLGEIVSGIVQAVNSQALSLGLDMKAEGLMPRNQQVPGERFRVHDRVRTLLLEVKSTNRGPQIILSRAHRNFLRRLLENEVPEIYHGMVEIRSIAREPGHRSKVAVAALQPGVDPVGACVGIRGVRIQAIVRELNDEKIDVIEWNPDPAIYIAKALSPARVTGVYLNELAKGAKTATVVVPEDQLSLAIGRDGQNARLAAKLTAWRIDIKSLPEAASDALYKLQNDPDFSTIVAQEAESMDLIIAILAKKAEGRPVQPEEYQQLSQFVDRVERGLLRQQQKEKQAEEERRRVIQAQIPDAAFTIPLEELGISPRFTTVIGGAGYTTVGDLMLQMRMDSDAILGLSGIGPKAMESIDEAISGQTFEELVAAAEEAVEAVEDEVAAEVVAVEAAAEDAGEIVSEGEPEAVVEPPEALLEAAEIAGELEAGTAAAVTVEEQGEEEPESELVAETVAAGGQEGEEVEVDAEEMPASLDELFALRPEVLEYVEPDDDDEDEEDTGRRKKKKKKKKKFVEMEYDPEKDVVVVKRKRKRGGLEDWDEEWSS